MGPEQALGVMCSHASMNGVPSCANRLLLNQTLRYDWRSTALVRSDCCGDMQGIVEHGYVDNVQAAVVSAVSAGLQYCFGCGKTKDVNASREGFAAAIAQGVLPVSSLDDAIAAGLLHRFQLGEFDRVPEEGPFGSGYAATVDSAEHHALARQLVAASVVVLENDGLLPLALARPAAKTDPRSTGQTVAVIGPFGHCTTMPSYTDRSWVSPNCYCHNYAGVPSNISTVFSALAASLPGHMVRFEEGCAATPLDPPSNSSIAQAVRLAESADVVILALGLGANAEREGIDRYNLTLPTAQQALLREVSIVTKQLVVLLFAAGPVDSPGRAPWPGNALLQVGYPGQEAGSGITDVLLGAVNPSGRLPLTWVTDSYLAHVGNLTEYSTAGGAGRTYRYIANTSAYVNYWFGHGLSFTRFRYDNVAAAPMTEQGVVRVAFMLTNVGDQDGAEIVQLYVTAPPLDVQFPTPIRSLCGVVKVAVSRGAASSQTFDISMECMATVQPDGSSALSRTGMYSISVGGNQPGDPRGQPTTVVTVKASDLHV